ncbi:MAG: divergent PAP2 family protein [Treponema sp.]|nr:divergent PAP2 family protein [Treponema sp.]
MSEVIAQLKLFFSNPIVLSCLFSWFCCQVIKTLINLFTSRITSARDFFDLLLFRTGSMPSSHSSLVAALTTTVFFMRGLNDELTLVSLCFYLVTIRDAVGVRRASGEQAVKINEMGELLKRNGIDFEFKKIKEVQGHTPFEVFIGSLIGVFFGVLFAVIH